MKYLNGVMAILMAYGGGYCISMKIYGAATFYIIAAFISATLFIIEYNLDRLDDCDD